MAQVLLMPQRRFVAGRACSALPFFILFIILSVAQPVASFAEDRPAVRQQTYDDDCGLAALRMLLERADIQTSDRELLAGLNAVSGEDALSAVDLSDMVRKLNAGVQLEVGFVPLSRLEEFAQREPLLVLIKPHHLFDRVGVIGHFVLVETTVAGGFVVADPVLPQRTRLSREFIENGADGKLIEGEQYIMVLRLMRDGVGAATSLKQKPSDDRLRDWERAYLLPQVLPKGKQVLSVSQLHQRDKITDPAQGLAITGSSEVTVLNVARGIGNRAQIGVSLARISGTGEFRLPGETLSFGRSGSINGLLQVDHIPNVILPPSLGLSTFASIEWGEKIVPTAAAVGANLDWTNARFGVGLSGDLRYDGQLIGVLTPSISYRLPTKSTFLFDFGVTAPYRIGTDRPDFEFQAAVHRQFGTDIQISAFLSKGIFQPAGVGSHQFGLTLTYGIPRRFRRSKLMASP